MKYIKTYHKSMRGTKKQLPLEYFYDFLIKNKGEVYSDLSQKYEGTKKTITIRILLRFLN